jgi:hypothetical protein
MLPSAILRGKVYGVKKHIHMNLMGNIIWRNLIKLYKATRSPCQSVISNQYVNRTVLIQLEATRCQSIYRFVLLLAGNPHRNTGVKHRHEKKQLGSHP